MQGLNSDVSFRDSRDEDTESEESVVVRGTDSSNEPRTPAMKRLRFVDSWPSISLDSLVFSTRSGALDYLVLAVNNVSNLSAEEVTDPNMRVVDILEAGGSKDEPRVLASAVLQPKAPLMDWGRLTVVAASEDFASRLSDSLGEFLGRPDFRGTLVNCLAPPVMECSAPRVNSRKFGVEI